MDTTKGLPLPQGTILLACQRYTLHRDFMADSYCQWKITMVTQTYDEVRYGLTAWQVSTSTIGAP